MENLKRDLGGDDRVDPLLEMEWKPIYLEAPSTSPHYSPDVPYDMEERKYEQLSHDEKFDFGMFVNWSMNMTMEQKLYIGKALNEGHVAIIKIKDSLI